MRRAFVLLLVASVIQVAASVQADPIGVGDGDRVVFYGDKMVDPPGFGLMVEMFVRVAYPESTARFYHVGARGFEKTAEGNAHFDERVAPLKPTVVVLCWGMGDGELKKYSDERVARATSEFEELVARCKKLGAKVFILTPPCPTVSKKNILSVNKYDETIEKISQAWSRIGSEQGAIVLDWFSPTHAVHERGDGASLTEKDGMMPSAKSNALIAKMILDAWKVEPLRATVSVDWNAGTASSTHGQVTATKVADSAIRLEFADFPLPYYTGKRAATFRETFAVTDYVQLTLRIDGLAGGTITMAARGMRKPLVLPVDAFRAGLNLSNRRVSPLARSKVLRDFAELVATKNGSLRGIASFKKQYLDNDAIEPELRESYKTHVVALEQYHDGMIKLIERTPRTMKIVLELLHTPAGAR
jgi:GDSL-like Lipase/Acylhydrolase family